MGSIVLTSVGKSVGGAVAGSIGAMIGSQLGGYLGNQLDNAIFGTPSRTVEGARLEDLSVQTSTYGKMIPIIYGSARIAGNIIWSCPIKETTVTQTSGGKGGGGTETTTKTYQYSVSLAIAICEGEIDGITRVWADAKQLELGTGTYRLYKGTENQLPDPFIESFEGVGTTPAYRGIAYVVIEDFPLADYGNRIPNFTFEIAKRHLNHEETGKSLEDMITAVNMIPGSGEFVYDTLTQYKISGQAVGESFIPAGTRTPINQHNHHRKANALVSLDNLADTCCNLEWVSVVVTWFGNSLNAGSCEVFPAVEYKSGAITEPDSWMVAGIDRNNARQMTLVEGTPRYGGTVSDESLKRYLTELKSRGYKVMLYPMMFMDIEGKPWRGHITGSTAEVRDFFTKTNGYNEFINHYTGLVAELNSTSQTVDAFVIGSEMIGLTSVTDGAGGFPAVDELINLASTVKTALGSAVKLTYAADWSEYHHTSGGWYNLDPLWASPNIDVIGIDAYFPLTNKPQDNITLDDIINGWMSGEGYDFYYMNSERTETAPLSPEWAWKNIAWWWNNYHTNPNSNQTSWIPQSKKIWFTEYGFPSVDGATNQPNVFYDPVSSDGGLPHHSKGLIDITAQRNGLIATELEWENSSMVENKFVWSWDARPYPFYPDLTDIWADGELWYFGHWINGKLGLSSLAAIVANLCEKAGLTNYDVSDLDDLVYGFIVPQRGDIRSMIEVLMRAYFFDAVESDGILKFVKRGRGHIAEINKDELILNDEGNLISTTRMQEAELPKEVDILYMDKMQAYQTGSQSAKREEVATKEKASLNLPLVLTPSQAKNIAQIMLYLAWTGRTKYSFSLPIRYGHLEPSDVIKLDDKLMRIISVHQGVAGELKIQAMAEDISIYSFEQENEISSSKVEAIKEIGESKLEFIDIPILPTDREPYLRFALCGLSEGWKGAGFYYSLDNGASYTKLTATSEASVIGAGLNSLGAGSSCLIDEENYLNVILISGELESITLLGLYNGGNIAVIGNEVIQFMTAELLDENKYRLSGLLRGRIGTENEIFLHSEGERFILLNEQILKEKMPIGLNILYKAVSAGRTLGETSVCEFNYSGAGLKPYSPVHLEQVKEAGGDISISWIRRTRQNGDWRDFVDVPLGEEKELYELDILDENEEILRTISIADTTNATYPLSQQVEDFGTAQDKVKVKVYQISSIVGRGEGGS